MNYSVETIDPFEKEAKRLYKKYPSLKKELLKLVEQLEVDPLQGTALGNDFYKIRLAIKSKLKGKSGGARIITLVKIVERRVFLASIYDKSDQSDITDKELKWLAEYIVKKK
jgi:hypothetical protein